nr:hypothetical protein [Tanacetum cinerariifolium]
MSITKEQQKSLDDVLVPREQRLRIGNCNYRLSTTFKPKEPTFQFALDVISLTLFYQAFLISASIPAIYMHEFWATISFQKQSSIEDEILAFIINLGYSRDIKPLSDVKYGAILPDTLTNQAMKESDAYKTYYDFANGKVIPKPKYVRRSTREKTDHAPKASPHKRFKATTKDNDDKVSMSKDDDENADNEDDDDRDDDNEQTKLDNDGDDFVHPKFSTHDEEARQDKEDKEKECSDLRVHTPSYFETTNDDAYDEVTQGDNVEEEKLDEETYKEEEVNKMYNDVNINLEGRDNEITDALLANVQATQVKEDTHVIITVVTPEVQQQTSSVSSGFISKMLNANPDTSIDSILNLNIESTSLVDVLVTTNDEIPPLSVTTFEDRVKSLEDDFLEFKQTNLFAKEVSSIPGIIDKYLANQMNKAVKAVVQLQSNRLRDEAKAENEDFINKIDDNIKQVIKEQVKVQVKEQVSKILPRIEKSVNEQLKAKVLIRSSNEAKTSHAVAANLSELELKNILIDKMENNKSIDKSIQQKTLYKALVDTYETNKDILATYGDTVTLKRRRDDEDEDDEPSAGSNQGLIDTPLDFSTFVLNRLKVNTLTPELLVGPTFELMKGSCKSLVELEYFLEEVYKVTTDQLDLNNPEGHQYPHDLRKPLPLIPNLRVTKKKAADYARIKWIEDLVPSTMWSQVPIVYDKHALWGIAHWGRKHQHFYRFTVNKESACDVYSRYRIIAISKLTIVKWHNYKYLDWITIRKDNDKLYTFKEDDYKRLCLQDIEDMLLLLV